MHIVGESLLCCPAWLVSARDYRRWWRHSAEEIWKRNGASWIVMGFLSLRWKRMIVVSPASMLPLNTELPFQLLGGPVNIFWQSNQGVLQEIELTPYRSLFDGITEGRVKVDRWRWWEDDKTQSSHRIENTAPNSRHRHDLGSHLPVPEGIKENICQVRLTGSDQKMTYPWLLKGDVAICLSCWWQRW